MIARQFNSIMSVLKFNLYCHMTFYSVNFLFHNWNDLVLFGWLDITFKFKVSNFWTRLKFFGHFGLKAKFSDISGPIQNNLDSV